MCYQRRLTISLVFVKHKFGIEGLELLVFPSQKMLFNYSEANEVPVTLHIVENYTEL